MAVPLIVPFGNIGHLTKRLLSAFVNVAPDGVVTSDHVFWFRWVCFVCVCVLSATVSVLIVVGVGAFV